MPVQHLLRRTLFAAAGLASLLIITAACSVADEKPASKPSPEARNLALLLIKNALIAVNQGNLTGNYTVLRDLSSPGFRQRNSASDLGAIFGNLRKQKLDLSPIMLLDPVITQSKFSKEENLLRLTGFFPSEPVQIKFDLIFQMANPGGWMIDGVSIGTEQVEAKSRNEADETANRAPAEGQRQTPKNRPVKNSEPSSQGVKPASGLARPPVQVRPKR